MPLIMLRGKVWKNGRRHRGPFISLISSEDSTSERGKVAIFPLLFYCKQPLLGEVDAPVLPVSRYEIRKPGHPFTSAPFQRRFDIIATSGSLTSSSRHVFLAFPAAL